ncbi:HAUS augmin-like complex subunit 6 [Osmerus mordax]|uniref:HAUS augmin-like complex subunit 6 n=1 Tax=Osmerus mordax TaxID=8014 RepID=UPI00350F27CB
MSNSQKTNGRYLWWALMGLGIQPEVAASHGASKGSIKHINLGPNMFDRPNKDAFCIVTHFLLEKLNPSRFHDSYRHCWPIMDHKADAEFRKITCAWLRDITDENGSAGPKVVASLFLSPGGPKFINLMLWLANHVMLQDMKTLSTDGTWVPEAAWSPASCPETAEKRLCLVRSRFLRAALHQDQLLQEYQRQAQSQVKSLRDRRAEDAKYEDLLKLHNQDTEQDSTALAQKIQKVRSLWSRVEAVLSALQQERRVVESVLRGEEGQYVLDGRDLDLHIPPALLRRVEHLQLQGGEGGVYEGGQMNLLRTLELLTHALRLLGEEWALASRHGPASLLHPRGFQEKSQEMARSLESLRLMRKKISREEVPEVKSVIRMLEEDWERRWAQTLKQHPLTSFLNDDPALNFLSPMAPLCFDASSEASSRCSIFSQYPAKLLEFSEEGPTEKDSDPLRDVAVVTAADSRSGPPAGGRTAAPLSPRECSPPRTTTLLTPAELPLAGLVTVPAPAPAPAPAPQKVSVSKRSLPHPQLSAVKKAAQILDWECDNLADQFSEAVTTSPVGGGVGVELGSLLSTLAADPFSSRKQLPRTPDSLIRDVKSCWRKAVEEGEAQKASRPQHDSLLNYLSPLSERQKATPSPLVLAPTLAPQHWASLPPPASSLSSSMQPLLSQNSLLLFSLDNETLPEPPCGNSLLSSEDEEDEGKEEDEEEGQLLLPHIPSLRAGVEPVLLAARKHVDRLQQAYAEASFTDAGKRAPEATPSSEATPGDRRDTGDWLMDTPGETATTETTNKVFSLDLEALGIPSSPRQVPYCLPPLVTFSPIDDM